MKNRVTITLDPDVVQHGKQIANYRHTTLSGLVESLLREQGYPDRSLPATSFSQRWRGKLSLRHDPSDTLLQALKDKYGLTQP